MREKRKSIALAGMAATLVVGLISLPALAERILYLDASAPGQGIPGVPAPTWLDQTSNEYDFVAVGSPYPALVDNPGETNDYWDFEQNSGFKGIGNEDLFDFETDVVAGAELGDPFSINVYMNWDGPNSGDTGYTILTKANVDPNTGHFNGYTYQFDWSQPATLSLNIQGGDNQLRHFSRVGDPAGTLVGRDAMLTVTHDGSGQTSGTTLYVDSVEINVPSFDESDLVGSTLNGDQVEIGITDDRGPVTGVNNGMDADVYFVEIYDHVLTLEEISNRWNNGSPMRATVDPVRTSGVDVVGRSWGTVSDMMGLGFLSETGNTYELQCTLGTNPPSWTATGATVDGTGGTLILQDPNGFDSNKTYRVFNVQL